MANVVTLLNKLRAWNTHRKIKLSPLPKPRAFEFHVNLGEGRGRGETITKSSFAIIAPTPHSALRQFLKQAKTKPLKELLRGPISPEEKIKSIVVMSKEPGLPGSSELIWHAKGMEERDRAKMEFRLRGSKPRRFY